MGYTFKRPDPAAMERVLTQFPYSPEGAILRLAWLEGLSREEIAALTWDQVQFEDNALTLPDRTVPLAPSAEDCLRERHRLYAQRDPHVIISDRYQRPMPPESVSRAGPDRAGHRGPEGQSQGSPSGLRHPPASDS